MEDGAHREQQISTGRGRVSTQRRPSTHLVRVVRIANIFQFEGKSTLGGHNVPLTEIQDVNIFQ